MIRRAAALILCLLCAAPVAAAPESRLIDPAFAAAAAISEAAPDHAAWGAILAARVTRAADGSARFDYGAATADEKAALKAYLARLQAVDPARLARPDQTAFWINLYNAATVDLMLEAWPVASIKSVKGGLFGSGPWDEKILTVAGRGLSLNDIEHGILRPVTRDPRIHYAVNCASLGCPDLAAAPYEGATLEAALDAAARAYVNHPRGAEAQGGRLVVSSIYRWYKADFGGDDAGVIAHLKAYAEAPLRAALEGVSEIASDRYDWRANAP